LNAVGAQPSLAKAFLIGAYGAGPRATRRRIELQEQFVELVAVTLEASDEAQRFKCEAVVAAVSSMATARIGTERDHELGSLAAPLRQLARELAW
jgi:hypothetical protein